ncbi:MAG: hypothetical protein A3B91_02175 [Candidatus Yanofskybacteria bacterium RIFCSPHIGHO2_02_FULL_41_29]|uniref:DUF3105 domain-containing protein n=1 Tax=Candidatus Yanofskybacteria bacterium RIFCSPHIGHO2_01_FULL_41_53 TaxID=1802663 RepID=A0A1F8EGK9_9BACT|nr:MAG: hypothetical protein A2650_04950 [Candidatus Yanofskybacteria bacterium RIFCSPHIGHO2_01_FULL_41_53]OGN12333.1 MAG: hypothetical protein A3B91_02175 [Candidatus Yanofskybacteria bacterium RIFCSPHIGHO2_02_FULL_41_29]OGN17708.1 MAG: hypothetical protein A3F48_00520 [Candidatus Yanofskybacteria bacterium RIFCSPHIGHO2_12_FULL_41_9]OGN22014.1 MAG: hypothetical protein A2916_04290 [Candidatus Yanofskybacteria bacterium RIFCSPLOWO2_01_FULL_41_67]OGN28904.1 MAG: hypothetical protein A3H54_02050 
MISGNLFFMDNNLETKNEYFMKKQERDEMVRVEKKKKMTKKTIQLFVILAIIGALAWPIYSYFNKAVEQANKPLPGEYFVAQSRDHITVGQKHEIYNSNPPTGGWHYAQPAQSGIYDKEFPDEQLIHNLEHSHVWIAYRPDLSPDQVEKLADIAKEYGSKIIMTPRVANDSPIALVAWERLLKMDSVDEVLAREFVDAYRGTAGPEKIADFGFKDFRIGK